jgi:hypothetical protein
MPTFSHQAVLFHVAALIINTHSFLVKGPPIRHGICSSPWLNRQFLKVTLSTSRLHDLNRAGDGYYQDKVPRRAEFDIFEDDSMRSELSAIRKKDFKATLERIEKKNDFQASSVPYRNGVLLSPAGPETSLKAREGGYLANQAKLSLSYYVDIAWSVIILIFMVFWFRSKIQFEAGNYVHAFPNFNTMVLKDGFCINPTPKGPLGTLKLCGIADAILTSGSYLRFRDKLNIGRNKVFFYASAGYTLLHGAIHFFEVDQTGQIFSSANSMGQNVLGVALLAVITAFTPIGINGTFNQIGKKGGLVVGVAAWVAFVLFYMFGIKEKVYALTYINVTIFLSIFGSRALLLKKKDPRRLEFYMGPSVLKTIIATTVNIMVMCFEHLACKDWFASVGGHIWFDVTLWVMLMSAMAV